jgi:hypothetical protein
MTDVDSTALERLAMEAEIREVVARFCRGVDRIEPDLIRSCYHPGAVDDHGQYGGSVEDYLEKSVPRQRGLVNACHQLHQTLVEREGDAAVVETYATATERRKTDDGGMADDVAGVRFVDRFELRGGHWLIARRTVVIDWIRSMPADEGRLGDKPFRRGSRDRDDFLYAELDALRDQG